MHGLFTCSNSPNVEVCASAILVGTLQTYTDPSQVKNIDGGGMFRKRETVVISSDEGLTLETSAWKILTVANSRYQLS